MMRQTLDALQYLHLLGIAHLNLQPDNIIMETPFRTSVKLIDLGSARRLPKEGMIIRNLTTPLDYRGKFGYQYNKNARHVKNGKKLELFKNCV